MDDKEMMIEYQLMGRDIYSEKVLDAMRVIDRKAFVPDEVKEMAYDDTALPIGRGQTISQPYIVAYMAQVLDLQPDDKVLEIGTGCGYNAAVLSRLVSHVYSVEIIDWLAELSRENLKKVNLTNVTVHSGDGFQGWAEKSPFDKIILTAATHIIPWPLKKQLKIGGKILAPMADTYQKLILLDKSGEDDYKEHELIPVRFVPMTGEAGEPARWKKGMPKSE
jgi:protein-L-isoaspartate(D-aspartate) O-methyltransferase